MSASKKYNQLLSQLQAMKSVAIAFSGGVDSTFLLAAAKEALGTSEAAVQAIIGRSPTYPKRECDSAIAFARQMGISYQVVDTKEMSNKQFTSNPPHRCFVCKTTLFTAIQKVAADAKLKEVLEGSNGDDVGDFRPGMDASRKLGIRAPLVDLQFTKDEIRQLSKQMNLPTWDKPAMACLSSRIPYGNEINVEKLARIEKAENAIKDLGINTVRVRDHGDVGRIEVSRENISNLSADPIRKKIVIALKAAGYKYVCIDLEGYRSGAMNEVLSQGQQDNARNPKA